MSDETEGGSYRESSDAVRNSDPDPSPRASDEQVIADYLRGDRQVFKELDGWIRQALARRYPGLSREHEDLLQGVHAKLLGSLREGRYVGTGGLRPYVVGVVHHVAIDRLREIYRGRVLSDTLSIEPVSTEPDPYREVEHQGEDQLLHQALLAVPAGCRELWNLVLVECLSYEEIGRRLSIPAGTVKSRMWYCRRKALAIRRRLRLLQHVGPARSKSRRAD